MSTSVLCAINATEIPRSKFAQILAFQAKCFLRPVGETSCQVLPFFAIQVEATHLVVFSVTNFRSRTNSKHFSLTSFYSRLPSIRCTMTWPYAASRNTCNVDSDPKAALLFTRLHGSPGTPSSLIFFSRRSGPRSNLERDTRKEWAFGWGRAEKVRKRRVGI